MTREKVRSAIAEILSLLGLIVSRATLLCARGAALEWHYVGET